MAELTGACVCHGEGTLPPGASTATKSLLVSATVVRPLVDLAIARMLDAHQEVPSWSLNRDLHHCSLLLVDRWIGEVCLMLREPALGLMALANVGRSVGDMVELAAEHAETLLDALLVTARFATAVNEAATVHLHVHDGSAILAIGSRIHSSRALRDYLVGVFSLAVSRWLGPALDLELWFSGPRPSHAPAYRRALGDGVSVRFGAPSDALVLPAASLWTAMPCADRRLHDFLLRVAQRMALCYAR